MITAISCAAIGIALIGMFQLIYSAKKSGMHPTVRDIQRRLSREQTTESRVAFESCTVPPHDLTLELAENILRIHRGCPPDRCVRREAAVHFLLEPDG